MSPCHVPMWSLKQRRLRLICVAFFDLALDILRETYKAMG